MQSDIAHIYFSSLPHILTTCSQLSSLFLLEALDSLYCLQASLTRRSSDQVRNYYCRHVILIRVYTSSLYSHVHIPLTCRISMRPIHMEEGGIVSTLRHFARPDSRSLPYTSRDHIGLVPLTDPYRYQIGLFDKYIRAA